MNDFCLGTTGLFLFWEEVFEEEDKKEFRTKAGTGGDLGLLLFLLEDEV